MTTYYVHYYDILRGEVLWWMRWPLVRVTRTRRGEVERVLVGKGIPVKPPTALGMVEIRADGYGHKALKRNYPFGAVAEMGTL